MVHILARDFFQVLLCDLTSALTPTMQTASALVSPYATQSWREARIAQGTFKSGCPGSGVL